MMQPAQKTLDDVYELLKAHTDAATVAISQVNSIYIVAMISLVASVIALSITLFVTYKVLQYRIDLLRMIAALGDTAGLLESAAAELRRK